MCYLHTIYLLACKIKECLKKNPDYEKHYLYKNISVPIKNEKDPFKRKTKTNNQNENNTTHQEQKCKISLTHECMHMHTCLSDLKLIVMQSVLQELPEHSLGWIHLQLLGIDLSLYFTLPIKCQIILVTGLNFLKVFTFLLNLLSVTAH